MTEDSAKLSGKRWNRLHDEVVKRYNARKEMLMTALLADGFPPFGVPVPPRQQYDTLVGWQQSQDPRYWNDPAAQAALAKLSTRFGPPPPIVQLPFGGDLPNNPAVQARLSQLAQKLGPPQSLVGGMQ